MAIRFPKVCFRCGSLNHCSEDCDRMPAGLGMSQFERDMVRQVRQERAAICWAAVAVVLALSIQKFVQVLP